MSSLIHQVLKYGTSKAFTVSNVSKEEAARRYTVCKNCPLKQYDEQSDKCMFCGCFMEIKTQCKIHRNVQKMRYEVTHCPYGFWDDKDIANNYRKKDGLQKLE